MRLPTRWQPLSIAELQPQLGSFTDWVLCGGHSVDLLLGKETRTHADIDIGVFRSQLSTCLRAIGGKRVFLCQPPGAHTLWDGGEVDAAVHDIWISDESREHWSLQIMVFDDEGETVFYRRDRRIHWPKTSHAVTAGNVRALNPLITLLYKANKPAMENKEIMDINALISTGAAGFS